MSLIELLPAVPSTCNRSFVTETESNDLQILTVPCSSCELNVRNRGQNYKVCFVTETESNDLQILTVCPVAVMT